MASFQPNQEGINQIVGLLTEVHKPGANQSEVRAWDGHLGALEGYSSWVTRPWIAQAPPARVQAAAAASPRAFSSARGVPPIQPDCLLPFPAQPLCQVYAQLDKCRAYPDFNSYLAFIFASGEGLPIEVRLLPPACPVVDRACALLLIAPAPDRYRYSRPGWAGLQQPARVCSGRLCAAAGAAAADAAVSSAC